MNIKNFKNFYLKIAEHPLYNDPTLKIFADTYLNSNQKTIYKLYYKYVFRTDIVRRHIKENYPWLLKKSKFFSNNMIPLFLSIEHILLEYVVLKSF